MAGAVDLAVGAGEPLGEVASEDFVGFRLGKGFLEFDVVGAEDHFELEADFWEVEFDGFEHVHDAGGVVAVPGAVVIVVAAGDEVGDGVFGGVGVDFGGADGGVEGVGLGGDGKDDGELDAGFGEDVFKVVVLVEVAEELAEAGFDFEDGDVGVVEVAEEASA